MMTVDQMQTARLDAVEPTPNHIVRGMVVDHNDAGYIWVERAGEQWSFRVALSNRAAVSEHLVDTEVTVCLREMRKRYATPRMCEYAECGSPLPTCPHDASADVLALCDEVEALRARVAAAPEVLREWPARAEDAPGEWFFCIHGDCAPRGTFEAGDGLPVFRDDKGDVWPPHEFEPGEFFVRCP